MTETVLKIELNNHNTDPERTRRVPLGEQELLILPRTPVFGGVRVARCLHLLCSVL